MRERLIKLFEFLKAYTDLRFPPVRDIAQQPQSLWLEGLPAHPSVELFRDVGKSEEEIYAALKLDYIPPEMRENCGEIDVAEKHALPKLVAEDADLQAKIAVDSVLVLQSETPFQVGQLPDSTRWDVRQYGRNQLMIWVKE